MNPSSSTGGGGGEGRPLATTPPPEEPNNPTSSSSSSPPPSLHPAMVLSDGAVRTIFLLLGVGILIPWNAFVSAKPYFAARLCDGETGRDVVNFEQYFGLVWNVSSVMSLGLIIAGQAVSDWRKKKRAEGDGMQANGGHNRIATHDPSGTSPAAGDIGAAAAGSSAATATIGSAIRAAGEGGHDHHRGNASSSHRSRARSTSSSSSSSSDHSFLLVMVPLFLFTLVFSVQTVLVLVPGMAPHRFLALVLVGMAVCGTCGAIATAGVVSTAGLFPPHLGISPFFSGQALGGVVVSVANFAAATIEDPQGYWSQHCNHTETAQMVEAGAAEAAAAATTMTRIDYFKEDNRQKLHLSHRGDGLSGAAECSPYSSLDWAVFSYFLAGCIVLLLCLVGYHQIHNYRNVHHRDDYEFVLDNPSDNDADHIVEGDDEDAVDGGLPRIGSGLNGHIERRGRDVDCSGCFTSTASTMDVASDVLFLVSGGDNSLSTAPGQKSVSSEYCPKPLVVFGCIDDQDENDGENDPTSTHNHLQDQVFVDEEYTDELDEGAVLSAIKGPATCVFLVFTVTLCLFPSWVSELRSSHQCHRHFRLNNDLYVPWSFVLFNVGDLVGRLLSERVPVGRIRHLSKKLVVAAACRVAFFPLFLMCLATAAGSGNGHDTTSWWVIRSDFFSSTVQFLFAVTNGLLVSTAFMQAPRLVGHTTELQERSSEIMTFAVYFGLLSGSMLAFPYLDLATRAMG